MGKFVRSGQRVVVEPNIVGDRSVEQAANTPPEVVAAVAGADVVAVDAYGTRFFGKTPRDIAHLVRAAERGLGTIDLTQVAVREESV